jgi:hypothetical protein
MHSYGTFALERCKCDIFKHHSVSKTANSVLLGDTSLKMT